MLTANINKRNRGIEFSHYVCALFYATSSTTPQRAVTVQLATSLYWEFSEQLVTVLKQQRQEEAIHFAVDQMSGVGQSKVRHVGGWAMRKDLNHSKEMCSQSAVPLWPELKPSSHLKRTSSDHIQNWRKIQCFLTRYK